ncbi:hypothetical protein AKJ09_00642 [Labilithrix luteola]|uniref:Uncharacterized protein n=1 Tax=Labilithrix luteola TaxID=1391654 RepID=A0A0K1PKB0_9BACT|nr:hypothetical protein [Labilithrix luteola]AKU93978.1 hypothetical protein AKJ09_00642 [Labilithrix luteola]
MKMRLGLGANGFSRQILAMIALSGVVAAAVHCSSDPEAEATASKNDAGTTEEAPPDSEDPGEVLGDAGSVVGSDGGTIDSGRDAGEVITVCGGSKGDPTAVPLLDWRIHTFPSKYAVALGVKSLVKEPIAWNSNDVIVTGTEAQDIGTSSSGISGGGAFGEMKDLSRANFANNAMPKTDVGLTYQKTLGWSDTLNAVYDLRSSLNDLSWKTYRVTGRAGSFTDKAWRLQSPVRGSFASDTDYYVQAIEPDRGMGWFVTVLFDDECKGAQFDALVGGFPLAMFDPPAPHTRAEVSKFLVDNNARLLLTVVTFGAENAAVKAALNGTQASAATLDDFRATMTALKSALDSYMRNPGPPDYAKLKAGTDPNWVIGRVVAVPVPPLK